MFPLESGDPRRLGGWRLEGRLGSGGMGVVYRGRRRRRRAAVKVLRAELARDPGYRERFHREAEAASRVVSMHTARLLEVQSAKEPLYLVTEFVDGPTLHQAVAEHGPFHGRELRDLASGIAHAIAAMRAAGVAHRDLTPGNVILRGTRPVVIDFGIARAGDDRTMTGTGITMGTPGWMAPEQARGERAGPSADLFAWGLLVAFAATGRPPFGTGRADEVLYRVVHEKPDLAGIDPDLAPIVALALDKRPARRPRPEELLHALARVEGLPATEVAPAAAIPTTAARVLAPPVPAHPPRAHALRRRAARRVLVAVGVLTLLAGAAAGGVYLAHVADNSRAAADQARMPATASTTTTTPPKVTIPPPDPTTTSTDRSDVSAYCTVAQEYTDRLAQSQADLGLFPSQDDVDQAFIRFARENQGLVARFRRTAPARISAALEVELRAFQRAARGDLSGYDTAEYQRADEQVSAFDEDQCGVSPTGF